MRRYYQILGVSPNATLQEIKEAYIFSHKAFHPDKFSGSSAEQQRIAHERTKAINEAYSVLSDPIRRANYDREYIREVGGQAGPSSAPPPPPPPTAPPPITPTEKSKSPSYWKKFLSDFFLLQGRIGRATFIVRSSAILGALALIVAIASANDAEAVAGLFSLICVISFVIQAGKRLHDVNASAGWVLAGVTGLGLIVLSILLPFSAGTKGPNRFGPQLLASRNTKIVAGAICGLALLSLGLLIANEASKPQRSSTGPLTSAAPSASPISPLLGHVFDERRPDPSTGIRPLPRNPFAGEASRGHPFAQTSMSPPLPQPQAVDGSEIHYSLTVPTEWTVKRKQELSGEEATFDLIASHKSIYVGVIAEEANLGDADGVVALLKDFVRERATEARFSGIERASIDGRSWKTFSAHVTLHKIPFAYQYYVYTGPEGTFQLSGWTFENLFERDVGQIRQVLESFKFPPATSAKREARSATEAEISSPPAADEQREFDLPTLAKNARRAVVLIVGFDSHGKPIKTGSGFFVSRAGRIVTNWHVVDSVTTAAAKTEDGAIYKISGVLAYSTQLDLAVLKAEAEDVPFLALESETPEAGSRIAVIGSPLALEGTLSEGIVSAVRRAKEGTWIQMTAPVSPGSSGSPVLNQHGRVIGVATLNSAGRYQNLNFARSSQDLAILVTSARGVPVQPFAKLATWGLSNPTAREAPPEPDNRRTATVTASDSNGLHLRADHTAKSKIVATVHHGDQLIVEDANFRNDDPPEPVVWQKVTTSDGKTGWIRADYISSSDSTTSQ